jgi:hypothetical protein
MNTPIETKQITIEEFYDMLEKHDWYYDFADDHRYWKAGKASLEKIKILTQKDSIFARLYLDYSTWIFSNSEKLKPNIKDYI